MITTKRHGLIFLIAFFLMWGCGGDETYTKYSRYKADFAFFYVQTTTPLREALYSPGIYCTIKLTATGKLVFTSLNNSLSLNVGDNAYYQKYVCISGFLVGYSNMIEMGADEMNRVCYDLACSNCYHDDAIKRDLTLKENGIAYCQRCKRTYSLNNMGMISSGDPGRPLERYHISLPDPNRMVIYN